MRGRQLLVTVALVLAALLVLGIAVWWMLFRDTASTRRPVVTTSVSSPAVAAVRPALAVVAPATLPTAATWAT